MSIHVSRHLKQELAWAIGRLRVTSLEAIVLPGGKTMKRLYGNGRKFTSFLLTSPALVIEHLQY